MLKRGVSSDTKLAWLHYLRKRTHGLADKRRTHNYLPTKLWVQAPLRPACLYLWARYSRPERIWYLSCGEYYNVSAEGVCPWPVSNSPSYGNRNDCDDFLTGWYRQQRFVALCIPRKRYYTNVELWIQISLLSKKEL